MARLLDAAPELVPGLDRAEFAEAIARDRPGTPDNLPAGRPDRAWTGVVLAAGHYRHGVLLAPLTARLRRRRTSRPGTSNRRSTRAAVTPKEDESMTIILNGDRPTVRRPAPPSAAPRATLTGAGVAVAVNGDGRPARDHCSHAGSRDGDVVEVVTAVQGG